MEKNQNKRIETWMYAQFILTIWMAGITGERRAPRDNLLLCMQDIIMKIYPGRRVT